VLNQKRKENYMRANITPLYIVLVYSTYRQNLLYNSCGRLVTVRITARIETIEIVHYSACCLLTYGIVVVIAGLAVRGRGRLVGSRGLLVLRGRAVGGGLVGGADGHEGSGKDELFNK
jgi:hypothetical protein